MAKAVQVCLKKDAWEMKPIGSGTVLKNIGNAPSQDGRKSCQAESVAMYYSLNPDHSGCGLQDLFLEQAPQVARWEKIYSPSPFTLHIRSNC